MCGCQPECHFCSRPLPHRRLKACAIALSLFVLLWKAKQRERQQDHIGGTVQRTRAHAHTEAVVSTQTHDTHARTHAQSAIAIRQSHTQTGTQTQTRACRQAATTVAANYRTLSPPEAHRALLFFLLKAPAAAAAAAHRFRLGPHFPIWQCWPDAAAVLAPPCAGPCP
jgi:hypothetical protein